MSLGLAAPKLVERVRDVAADDDEAVGRVDEDALVPLRHYYTRNTVIRPVWRGLVDENELAAIVDDAASYYDRIWLVLAHTTNRALEVTLDSRDDLIRVGERHFTAEVDLVEYQMHRDVS